MKEIHHWIDGKEYKGTSGRFSDVFNPATGEVQARLSLATKAELDHAVERAAGDRDLPERADHRLEQDVVDM